MLKLILIYSLLIASVASIFRYAWFPAAIYSLNAVMQPKYLWRFEWPDIPTSKILAITTICAWLVALARKQIDFSIYKHKQVIAIVLMFLLMHLSNLVSPYGDYVAGTSADIVFNALNTLVVMFIVQLGVISNKNNYVLVCKAMSAAFIFLIVYYVYWANDHYISSNWSQFFQGRLTGPSKSPYKDANVASTMLVMGMPFILLLYFYVNNRFLKYGAVVVIPLLWHALFLFGSRGAFIALGISTLAAIFMLKKSAQDRTDIKPWQIRAFKLAIIAGLSYAIVYQGGSMISRSANTVAVASQEEREAPLNPRIISWNAGIGIIKEYPLMGAGPQRFQWAARDLELGTPHVAHNTFLNYSANTGLIVGFLFLYILWTTFSSYNFFNKHHNNTEPLLDYLNKACTCSMLGYAICSLFLDLIIFEPFYFLLLLVVFKNHMAQTLNLGQLKRPTNNNAPKKKLFKNQIDAS